MATPRGATYSAGSGVTIYGGRGSVLPSFETILPFGDSLTALSYASDPARWGVPLARNTPRIWWNGGVPNDTLQDMLNRQATAIANAATYGAEAVMLRAGTNGPGGGTFATKYAQIVDDFIAAGLFVFCCRVPPRTGGDSRPYNSDIQAICAARPDDTLWIPDADAIAEGEDQPISGSTLDGIHMSATGQYLIGNAQAPYLEPYFQTDPLLTDSGAVAAQWVTNPLNTGTGGTKSGGTGAVPDSVSVSAFGSGTSFVASIVAADVEDANQTPWLHVELSASGGNSHSIEIRYSMVHPAIDADLLTHRAVDCVAEVQLVALDTTNVLGLQFGADASRTYISPAPRTAMQGNGTLTKTLVLRNTYERSPANAHSANALKAMLNLVFSGADTAMGAIRVRCVSAIGLLP